MRKGIAIPYVIALILGVAIVGLIGFWFVSTGGKFSGQSQSTYCGSEELKFCVQGLAGGSPVFNAPGCTQPNPARCTSLVGSSGGGGSPGGTVALDQPCRGTTGNACGTNLICCRASGNNPPDATNAGTCKGNTGFVCEGAGARCASGTCEGGSGAEANTLCSGAVPARCAN